MERFLEGLWLNGFNSIMVRGFVGDEKLFEFFDENGKVGVCSGFVGLNLFRRVDLFNFGF